MSVYFEGWYFKQQAGRDMLAVIPAVHTDGDGKRTGSVQVITPDKSYFVSLPGEAMRVDRQPLVVHAGDSEFSMRGITLNLQGDGISASGRLNYTGLVPPRGDIMGPYRFVPFMECRHSVFSMTHQVNGNLTVNGKLFDFSASVGYIEGDRGRSFPKRYVWAQCSWNSGRPCALMLSAADVRPLGREFIGVIGFVYLNGHEIRIATYLGAKVAAIGEGKLSVHQGKYTVTAELLEDSHHALRAPTDGKMVRLVKESLCCRARFTMMENESILFDFVTDQASVEYEF